MKRILIIEDDPIISRVYSSKYQSAGFETCCAEDGQAGVEQIERFKPDLVHLDLSIPKLNGVEVIKTIRSRPESVSLPVIVLSNTYQNRLVKAAFDAGATECISKSTCTPKMLLAVVEKYRERALSLAQASQPATQAAVVAPAAEVSAESGVSIPPPSPASQAYTTQIQRHASSHNEIVQGFLVRAPLRLAELRERVAPLFLAAETTRVADLTDLYRVTESFAGQAAVAGFEPLSQAALALSALLRELVDQPKGLTPSCVHTIVGASDFLSKLVERASTTESVPRPPAVVLVVDDDSVCRRAVCLAIARLNLPTISMEDPKAALRLASENRFSLVLVDVEMPGMSGFEFCRALRADPAHASTPVAFVTSLADEAARAQARAAGGNELIAKPFLGMELAVKALTLLG